MKESMKEEIERKRKGMMEIKIMNEKEKIKEEIKRKNNINYKKEIASKMKEERKRRERGNRLFMDSIESTLNATLIKQVFQKRKMFLNFFYKYAHFIIYRYIQD